MKYWTLFTLRLVARVGCLATLALWLVGHFGPGRTLLSPREWHLPRVGLPSAIIVNGRMAIAVSLIPQGGASIGRPITIHDVTETSRNDWPPATVVPGVRGLYRRPTQSFFTIDHWLLFLTFLIATIATSWSWKKKPADSEG